MRNRVVLIIFRAFIALFFITILASVHASESKPVAVVIDSYDFGTEFEGVEINHDYIIKNKGDADLEIKSVKSG